MGLMDLKGSGCLCRMLAVSCEEESLPDASPSYTVEDQVSGANMRFPGRALPFAGDHCRAGPGRQIT